MIMNTLPEYQKLFNDPENAKELTKIFWSISDFPSELLFEKLKEVSDADFDDDYSEFLKKDNLLKAGLAILGISSPRLIEAILAENLKVDDRLSKVADLFQIPEKGYLAAVRAKFEENNYSASFFPYMLATVAILITRSKDFLALWGKNFARIIEHHPTPDLAIKNILSIVFRGEALIVDNYTSTHRDFNACAALFVALADDENEEIKKHVWINKHTRIYDALGGK